MMNLRSQKRLAAKQLGCGISRVWIDPKKMGQVAEAITNEDIRKLISDGIMKAKPKKGVSRGRKKKIAMQKKKGRRKGRGSRKGKIGTRLPRKREWIKRIRAIRDALKELRDNGKINRGTYRELYKKAKGGFFRSRAHLYSFIEKENLAKGKLEIKKKTKKRSHKKIKKER